MRPSPHRSAIAIVLLLTAAARVWAVATPLDFVSVEDVAPLDEVNGMGMSPDGAHVYVGSAEVGGDLLGVFSRSSLTGGLTLVEVEQNGVGGVDGLANPVDVRVSPDGAHVYVAAYGAIVVFSRNATTGELTYASNEKNGVDGVVSMSTPWSIAISPDGASVYVASGTDSAVVVFGRDAGSGDLTFVEAELGGLVATGAAGVTVSPDGANVYVSGSNGIAVFERDPGDSTLDFVETVLSADNSYVSLAVTPDGAHVIRGHYLGLVTVFARDAGTGTLTPLDSYDDHLIGLQGGAIGAILTSPDGLLVYVKGISRVSVYARDPSSGGLVYVESQSGSSGASAISPDGAFLYFGYTDVTVLSPGFSGCGAAPLAGCRRSGRGILQVSQPALVQWRWSAGEDTPPSALGDPTFATDYAFCLYEESGPPSLVYRALAPAGGTCRGVRSDAALAGGCWKPSSGDSFRYRDPFRTPEGLLSIRLKPGADGDAGIALRGSGPLTDLPTLPSALPIRAQLQSATGECWEAVYSTAVANSGNRLKARPDPIP
jgi:DNA-binding beta-propeller fold protein YncE